MLAAAPNWGGVAIVVGIFFAAAVGYVVGWQTRGHHENSRRGGYLS